MQAEQLGSQKSPFREAIETIIVTLVLYFLIRTFLFENYRVVGRSMMPTLYDNQFLVVNKLVYRLQEPQRGDIVVFRDPASTDRKLIKRIIALPGDVVEIDRGQIYVNEQLIVEPYVEDPTRSSRSPTSVPLGDYYVLGDNRGNSSDSRSWGTLPSDSIVGRAWISYWPPELWGVLPHIRYD